MVEQIELTRKTDKGGHTHNDLRHYMAFDKGNRLFNQLTDKGLDTRHASEIATYTDRTAKGAISHHDWMQMDADRFQLETKKALNKVGIDYEANMDDKQAEQFAACVMEHEGIPDGNGGTERVNGRIVPGQFDNANHGIDLVAADRDGVPILMEVKKYNHTSAVHLTDLPLTGERTPFEPEVQKLARQRSREELLINPRFDKPSDVRQMNDLWIRDRWLKLIKSNDGLERLRAAGVKEQFLDYQHMRLMDCPEWDQIMENRKIVLVGGKGDNVSDYLLSQVIFENRAKMVFQIDIKSNNS